MAVTYGFFDSINGDRTYNADQISEYFLKLISNGVFATPSNSMQVTATTGLNVKVSPGWGFIKCKWVKNDNDLALQLDTADTTFARIDRVVLHLDTNETNRHITIEVKKGTPAATPAPPAVTRLNGVYELSLAQIAVAANATSITQANITDERADTSVCGYVTGLIDQIDTTNLFAQFTAAFNTWFDGIKDEVKSTTIVMQYHSRYVTTQASETTIPIQIELYNSTLDIMYVYINGIKLVPNVDYTISGTNIILTKALDVVGTPVEFEVLKSSDTAEASSIVTQLITYFNKVDAIEQRLDGLSFKKITQSDYDALVTKDSNTIYFVISQSGSVKEYLGEVELSGGSNSAYHVAAEVAPILSRSRSMNYLATPPADECEIFATVNDVIPTNYAPKAREKCIAILSYMENWSVNKPVDQAISELPPRLDEFIQKGWTLIGWRRFSAQGSGESSTDRVHMVFWRECDGSTVGFASSDDVRTNSGYSNIAFVYGATSFTKVFDGFPTNELLATRTEATADNYWTANTYGFRTTVVDTSKPHLYIFGRRFIGSYDVYNMDNGSFVEIQFTPTPIETIEGYLYNGKFYEDADHTTEILTRGNYYFYDIPSEKYYMWSGANYPIYDRTEGAYDYSTATDYEFTVQSYPTFDCIGGFMAYDNSNIDTLTYWVKVITAHNEPIPNPDEADKHGAYDAMFPLIILEFNYEDNN